MLQDATPDVQSLLASLREAGWMSAAFDLQRHNENKNAVGKFTLDVDADWETYRSGVCMAANGMTLSPIRNSKEMRSAVALSDSTALQVVLDGYYPNVAATDRIILSRASGTTGTYNITAVEHTSQIGWTRLEVELVKL